MNGCRVPHWEGLPVGSVQIQRSPLQADSVSVTFLNEEAPFREARGSQATHALACLRASIQMKPLGGGAPDTRTQRRERPPGDRTSARVA